MTEKLIVESKVKALLSSIEGVTSVGADVLKSISDDVRSIAEDALSFCRITPGGRLMIDAEPISRSVERRLALQMSPPVPEFLDSTLSAMNRVDNDIEVSVDPLPERLCHRAKETLKGNGGKKPESEPEFVQDWIYAVFNHETLLGFEEWCVRDGS